MGTSPASSPSEEINGSDRAHALFDLGRQVTFHPRLRSIVELVSVRQKLSGLGVDSHRVSAARSGVRVLVASHARLDLTTAWIDPGELVSDNPSVAIEDLKVH